MTTATTANGSNQALWRHLFGFIDRPTATFQAVLTRPGWSTWAVPLAVIILVQIIFTVVQTPYTLELARQQAEQQLATLPEEQVEAARAGMELTLSFPFMLATTLGFGLIALLIAIMGQATFLYFSALVMGGELKFGAMFNLSVWSRLPLAIGYLVMAGFTLVTQQLIQTPGLSFLVSSGDMMQDARNPLFVLLSQLDLFWLWQLFLVAVGLTVAARFSWGKSLLLTLLYAILVLGLTILPTLLVMSMMGGA